MRQSYKFFIILNIIIIFNSCSSIGYSSMKRRAKSPKITSEKTSCEKEETGNILQNLSLHQQLNKELDKKDKFLLARKYNKEGNYEKSLKIFDELIEKGSVRSIYNKACIYRDVKRDLKYAFMLFEQAAKKGLAEAQYNLVYMYLNGQGTSYNYNHGLYWIKKAARNNIKKAQKYLACIYYDQQNYNLASYWLKEASLRNN